jgi:hypothetical protein
VEPRCSSSAPANPGKRHYRYYVCANRAQDGSCAQPYIPAARLEGAVIGKVHELASRPDLVRPFLNREIKRRRAGRRDLDRRARTLERRLTELDARQREMVDWLAETMPGKATARKLNQKIETLEKEKNALGEEQAGLAGGLKATDLEGVSAEAVAGHLARFDFYFDRFNAGQRKALVEAVVRRVEIESRDRMRAQFTLPTTPLGGYDEDRQKGGSNWYLQWRPQRDSNVATRYGPLSSPLTQAALKTSPASLSPSINTSKPCSSL